MAIEFTEHVAQCPECGEDMICLQHDENADHALLLTNGQRDVLKDILAHVKELREAGKAKMSATDQTDLSDLISKVEDLYL